MIFWNDDILAVRLRETIIFSIIKIIVFCIKIYGNRTQYIMELIGNFVTWLDFAGDA